MDDLEDPIDPPTLAELLSPPNPTSSATDYLENLPNLPLESLLTEPTTLATQSHHLTSSLTSLTHTSYPTFLSIHKSTTSLSSSLASLSSSLDGLLASSLPALETSAAGWKDRTEGALKDRRKARVVLEQHEKIRDLLDVPLLIDTCVRNGYFGEALALANHVGTLAQSTARPSLIIKSVLAEVQHSISQLLHTLLMTLREPNKKLPALWKAVNFLRKMDAFGVSIPPPSGSSITNDEKHGGKDASGEELVALAFLSSREACLKASLESHGRDIQRLANEGASGGLKERDQEDLSRHLKKYIDLWREGVYDIVSQYTTIFLDGQPASSSAPPKSPTPQPPIPFWLRRDGHAYQAQR